MLDHRGVDHVVDVGANVGQYASDLRRVGYRGAILSVEPLSHAYAELRRRAASDPLWQCECAAVGAEMGHGEIHVAASSVSSSLATMLPRHLAGAPNSVEVGGEQVRLVTVDDLVDRHGLPVESTFVKVDTQGYEPRVVAGGARSMRRIAGAQLELGLVPLYEGDLDLVDGIGLMERCGLELVALIPGFSDPHTGEMLQCDGVFLRR